MKRGQLAIILAIVLFVAIVGAIGLVGISKSIGPGKAITRLPSQPAIAPTTLVSNLPPARYQEGRGGSRYQFVKCQARCLCILVDKQNPKKIIGKAYEPMTSIITAKTCGDCAAARKSCEEQIDKELASIEFDKVCIQKCKDRGYGDDANSVLTIDARETMVPPKGCQDLGPCSK